MRLRVGRVVGTAVVLTAVALPAAVTTARASAAPLAPVVTTQQVSTDTLPAFTPNPVTYAQHATELETDTFSWGSTVVSSFQIGRMFPSYGAQAMGWATSTDAGLTWSHGVLPGLTQSSPDPNPAYPTVVNQSVAYSARFGRWLIPSVVYLPAANNTFQEQAILLNTSPDGLTWSDPTTVVAANADKAWATCDNTPTSPFYGSCYIAYSQLESADELAVVYSRDGGATWSAPVNLPGGVTGYNTNPVVRSNGDVVLVATDASRNGLNGSRLFASTSTTGGASWSRTRTITKIQYHPPGTGLRALNKPSVDADSSGRIWVAWGDCRFRASCAHDDVVYATSGDSGTTWSAPVQVPPDAANPDADRFIPGFATDPASGGATTRLGLVYYTLLEGNCTVSTCRLDVQYLGSPDAGSTWSVPVSLNAVSMPLAWLAKNNRGRMVGDYESVSFCGGVPVTVVSIATARPKQGVFRQNAWAARIT